MKNREKARDYQKQYNIKYKKKVTVGQEKNKIKRDNNKEIFTPSDIMRMPASKASRLINQILYGERYLIL